MLINGTIKTTQKDDFDQQAASEAPMRWLKYTTTRGTQHQITQETLANLTIYS